jgi:hypothetical protein
LLLPLQLVLQLLLPKLQLLLMQELLLLLLSQPLIQNCAFEGDNWCIYFLKDRWYGLCRS